MPQYALARHVFVCAQGEHVVFLDVRKDRYFALESARTAGLGELVPGWPVPAPAVAKISYDALAVTAPALKEPLDRSSLIAVLALLLEREIITTAVGAGKNAAPVNIEELRSDVTAEALDETPRIGVGMFLRFVYAAGRAALLLKYSAFEKVVSGSGRRLEEARARGSVQTTAQLDHLVGVFSTLRPFFFTAKEACLFDAFALSEFLAGYGVYPKWVFGVQARPFAAHCWLQQDGVVLNDTVDHVKRYTPIMAI